MKIELKEDKLNIIEVSSNDFMDLLAILPDRYKYSVYATHSAGRVYHPLREHMRTVNGISQDNALLTVYSAGGRRTAIEWGRHYIAYTDVDVSGRILVILQDAS
jgi:hypothetical protein